MKITSTPDAAAKAELAGYEVLVSVCGGIAAYKVCQFVSELVQHGAGVTVAMTEAACRFVGPITFQALTGRPVLTSLWAAHDPGDVQHITRTEAADLLVVAPATANMLGKIAAGIADDLVSTLVISAASPVLLAPAMNNRMWSNAAVQRNVKTLTEAGFHSIGPAEGWLACRGIGPGRMVEAHDLFERAVQLLKANPPKAAEI